MSSFSQPGLKLTIDPKAELLQDPYLSGQQTVRASRRGTSTTANKVTPKTQRQNPNYERSPQQLSFTNPFEGSINISKTGKVMVGEATKFKDKIDKNKKMYGTKRYNDYLNGTLNIILKSFCNLDAAQKENIDALLFFNGKTHRLLTKEEYAETLLLLTKRYNDYLNGTLNKILRSFCRPKEKEQWIINDLLVFDGETHRFLTKEEYEGELSNEKEKIWAFSNIDQAYKYIYKGGKKTRRKRKTKKSKRKQKKRKTRKGGGRNKKTRARRRRRRTIHGPVYKSPKSRKSPKPSKTSASVKASPSAKIPWPDAMKEYKRLIPETTY